MRILVTGAAGYIGYATVQSLRGAGHYVYCYDVKSSEVLSDCGQGSVADIDSLTSIMVSNCIECVVHGAAFTFVADSCLQPHRYYLNNIAGALGLFEAMNRASVNRIVFCSSAAVYDSNIVDCPGGHPSARSLIFESFLHSALLRKFFARTFFFPMLDTATRFGSTVHVFSSRIEFRPPAPRRSWPVWLEPIWWIHSKSPPSTAFSGACGRASSAGRMPSAVLGATNARKAIVPPSSDFSLPRPDRRRDNPEKAGCPRLSFICSNSRSFSPNSAFWQSQGLDNPRVAAGIERLGRERTSIRST